MTDIEQRLRDELKAAASTAQPYMLRELALPPRRRGARAAGWLAPVAAVVAVIAIIVGAQAIFRVGRPASRPVAVTAMPRFYSIGSSRRDGSGCPLGHRRGDQQGGDSRRSHRRGA